MANVELSPRLGKLQLASKSRYLVGNLRLTFTLRIFEVGFQQLAGSPGQLHFAGRHLDVYADRFRALPVDSFDIMDLPRSGAEAERNSEDDKQQNDGNLAAAKPSPAGAILRAKLVPKLAQPQKH